MSSKEYKFVVKIGLVLILLFIIGSLIYLFGFYKKSVLTYKTLPKEETKQELQSDTILDSNIFHLPENIYPRGFSLIFFADDYLSWNEFDYDIQVIIDQMHSVEPWKSYKSFNIYKIFPKEKNICTVKVEDERKPVLRCTGEGINYYLNQLKTGHFKLIVLSRKTFQSWANVSRLSDSGIFFSLPTSPKVSTDQTSTGWLFLHLLGHAFGLKDEEKIVIAKVDTAAHKADGPNCAPNLATAKLWWGDLVNKKNPSVGFFNGCSANADFIKPTKGSFMNLNDLSTFIPTYGPISEKYLNQILKYCFSEKIYTEKDDPRFFEQYPEFKECTQ